VRLKDKVAVEESAAGFLQSMTTETGKIVRCGLGSFLLQFPSRLVEARFIVFWRDR